MKLVDATVCEIMHLKDIGYYLGQVELTFQPSDEPIAHNITVKVRIKETGLLSFSELEASILEKAVSLLSVAVSSLDGETPDTLYKMIADQEAVEQAERERSFEDSLKHIDWDNKE